MTSIRLYIKIILQPNTHWIDAIENALNTLKHSLAKVITIVICCDKWQSKTLFLTSFDLRSSIVLMFSIAAYPV